MNMGEFRELTHDVPNDWPLVYVVHDGDNVFSVRNTDASVALTDCQVEITDE